jgi:cytochrome c553
MVLVHENMRIKNKGLIFVNGTTILPIGIGLTRQFLLRHARMRARNPCFPARAGGKWAVRFGFSVLLLILFALPSAAAQPQNIEDKTKICAACHGENGVPVQQSSPAPVIWGQQLGYLFIELREFKSGARKGDLMSPIAQGLERADLLPLAQYFAQKTWPNLQQPSAAGDVAAEAERANASVVCTRCHQEGFKGAGTQPRLDGQVRAYLEKTMLDFRTGRARQQSRHVRFRESNL